jgi:hypothetical protein
VNRVTIAMAPSRGRAPLPQRGAPRLIVLPGGRVGKTFAGYLGQAKSVMQFAEGQEISIRRDLGPTTPGSNDGRRCPQRSPALLHPSLFTHPVALCPQASRASQNRARLSQSHGRAGRPGFTLLDAWRASVRTYAHWGRKDRDSRMDAGSDWDTGYYLVGNLIWGPKEPGTYRIEADGTIHGPGSSGTYRVGPNGRIYGPEESGRFRIEKGRIYGSAASPPWIPK